MSEYLNQFEPIAAMLQEQLTSYMALWVYSWLALGFALLLSLIASRKLLKIVDAFDGSEIVQRVAGAKPKRPEAIERRIDKLSRYAQATTSTLIWRTVGLILTGIIVPGSLLAMIVIYQPWLMPGEPALLPRPPSTGTPAIDALNLTIFIFDQSLRGALGDTLEVFDLSTTDLTNNGKNYIFSGFIFVFRTLAGLAMGAIAYVLVKILRGRKTLRTTIADLEVQLKEARAATA